MHDQRLRDTAPALCCLARTALMRLRPSAVLSPPSVLGPIDFFVPAKSLLGVVLDAGRELREFFTSQTPAGLIGNLVPAVRPVISWAGPPTTAALLGAAPALCGLLNPRCCARQLSVPSARIPNEMNSRTKPSVMFARALIRRRYPSRSPVPHDARLRPYP